MEKTKQNNQENKMPEMTETIVKMYARLAMLEKEGKKSITEYKSLLSLLPRSIELEKQEYQDTHSVSQDQEQLKMWYKAKKTLEDSYQLPSQDMLAKIRFYNRSNQEYLCTFNSMVTGDIKKSIQSQIEENFMIEICRYLKYGKVSEIEKNCLIDYKYGIITTSQTLEHKLLSEEFPFPCTSDSMTKEELHDSQGLVLAHIRSLCDYLCSIEDNHITEQTILYMLYMKACLPLLGSTLRMCKVHDISVQINQTKLFGKVMQKDVKKLCKLLSYAIETPSYQKKCTSSC